MNRIEGKVLVTLCTCPDEVSALKLAGGLVEERLAACVNILPGVRSVYRWQGETCDDKEVLMVIKSLSGLHDALESWLLEHHPYDVAEIVALPASRVSAEFLAWLESGVA
jgi:periplasmic divalent cation tolerance protein